MLQSVGGGSGDGGGGRRSAAAGNHHDHHHNNHNNNHDHDHNNNIPSNPYSYHGSPGRQPSPSSYVLPPAQWVGSANHFVSHSWQCDFRQLVGALVAFHNREYGTSLPSPSPSPWATPPPSPAVTLSDGSISTTTTVPACSSDQLSDMIFHVGGAGTGSGGGGYVGGSAPHSSTDSSVGMNSMSMSAGSSSCSDGSAFGGGGGGSGAFDGGSFGGGAGRAGGFGNYNGGVDAFYWVDVLSVDQNTADQLPPEYWTTTFRHAVESMDKFVAVLSPWDRPRAFTRAWCIWESYCCIAGPHKVGG